MKWSHAALLPVVIALLSSAFVPAHAWTEFLSMDVLPQNVGWTLFSDGGSSVLNGGIMAISTPGYREYRAPASWINTVSTTTGYTIEFRMRIVTQSHHPGQNVGLWYHDNTYLTVISFDLDAIYVSYPTTDAISAGLDATLWHTYRIVVLGPHHQIYVDGALTLDFQHPGTGDGSNVFDFGDLGGASSSHSQWDYIAYDTQAVVPVAPTTWGRLKTLYRGER